MPNNFFDSQLPYEKITLQVHTFTENHHMDKDAMRFSNIGIQRFEDDIFRRTVLKFEARVAGRDITTVVKYPADWKQAFKERWYPEWLLAKYPVQYTVYDARVLYPSMYIPEHQPYVQLMQSTGLQDIYNNER